jgi:RNA polymerase sigma-70 factor, ECF subfamily
MSAIEGTGKPWLDGKNQMRGYDQSCSSESSNAGNQAGSKALEQNRTLDAFLCGVEKRAYRMAQLATNNPDEALDIVQDAMLKLVEKYPHKGPEELGPLFYCILQSRIKDWYRRNLVRNRLRSWLGSADAADDEEDAMQQVADPTGRTPEEIVMVNGSIAALEVALRALPLRQQQVFLLRAWEGLDVRQTAAAMKCAEGSVKTHYSRALKALRTKLGEHWQ